MIIRIFFVSLFFTLIAADAKSQLLLGIGVGISNNYLNTNISNRKSSVIKSDVGYSINLPLHYQVVKWLTIETGPNFIQKNYTLARTDSLLGAYTRFKNTYIQLPLLMHVVYGNRLKIFIKAGGYIAYWISGHLKGETPNIFSVISTGYGSQVETFALSTFTEKYIFNSQRDNRIELGWIIGAGLQYKLTNKYSLFTEWSFNQSLTDQQKQYMYNQMPQYNQTSNFLIGGLYVLNRKHHVSANK